MTDPFYKERKNFEKWARAKYPELNFERRNMEPPAKNDYYFYPTSLAFEEWEKRYG